MAQEQSAVTLFPNKAYREQVEVEALILYLLQTQGSLTKTQLQNRTESNFASLNAYLKELTERGLITFYQDLFHITERGRKYLEAYGIMRTIRFSEEEKGNEAQ